MTRPLKNPALEAEQSESGAVRRSRTFHGNPCKDCGGTLRRSGNGVCVECDRQRCRERYRNDADFRKRHTAQQRVRNAERYARLREEILTSERERRATDPEWAERRRAIERRSYDSLDHIAYYERQLKARRRRALKKKEDRHGSLSDQG